MLKESKISSKNQVTIPKAVMERLGLSPRDRIVFQEEGGKVIIRPKNKSLAEVRQAFPRSGQHALSLEQMQDAINRGSES